MTIPNSATGANPGQLTPERFSQFLNGNPVFAAEFEKFQRTQSDVNPQTPDKDGAEKNDERKKVSRYTIELPRKGRGLNEFAADVGKVIPRGLLYNYGDEVVEVVRLRGGLESPIKAMDQVRFRTWLEDYVDTCVSSKDEGLLSMTINETDSKATLASDSFKRSLPQLSRVIDFPMPMLKDGKVIIPQPGYNEDIETYLQPTSPKIDYQMSMDTAKDVLDKLLGEFCFTSQDNGQSKTHAIAWLLTPYFRGMIPGELVPFWSFRANRPRSGKDYLAQVAHLIYTGEKHEDAALPERDPKSYEKSEETRKRITSIFYEGRRFTHFANCSGYIDDKFFIQAITAPVWSDRILGKTSLKSWRNEMMFSLSGNFDLALKPDIEPRSRCVVLEFFDEHENSRTFKTPNLHGWIRKNRGVVLSAIHAVFRNWCEAGQPDGKTPFTSFSEWARVVGGAMMCAGLGDPCQSHIDALRDEDPELAAMGALFRHCRGKDVNNGDQSGTWWTLPEVHEEISQNWTKIDAFGWFSDYYSDADGRLNKRSIGKLLRRWKGRSTGGITLRIDDRDKHNTDRHKLKFEQK